MLSVDLLILVCVSFTIYHHLSVDEVMSY